MCKSISFNSSLWRLGEKKEINSFTVHIKIAIWVSRCSSQLNLYPCEDKVSQHMCTLSAVPHTFVFVVFVRNVFTEFVLKDYYNYICTSKLYALSKLQPNRALRVIEVAYQ